VAPGRPVPRGGPPPTRFHTGEVSDMSSFQAVFHVGLHKTATTFLQMQIFPQLVGVGFVPPPARVRSILALAGSSSTLVVSDEGLSGIPFEPGWLAQFEANMRGLARLHPGAGIIIGFRSHADLIRSIYKQYLHEGGTEGAGVVFGTSGSGSLLQPEDLSFSARLDLLARLFDDRVFVYTQEEIRDELPRFVRDLETFLGARHLSTEIVRSDPLNVGVGSRQAELLRRLNKLNRTLRGSRVLPTLNNRLFRKLAIDPRTLCQRRLAGWSGGSLIPLPPVVSRFQAQWCRDWDRVLAERDARTSHHAGFRSFRAEGEADLR
jgi:hypothetical protein